MRLGEAIRWKIIGWSFLPVVTGLLVMVGIPGGYFLIGDADLRMSDDYAAVNGGVSIAILLIGMVDMHFSLSKAKDLAVAGPLTESLDHPLLGEMTREEAIRDQMRTLAVWLCACSVLSVSLMLMLLWAAIEDHGPARWVAWVSLLATGMGFAVLMISALEKLSDGAQALFDLIPEPDEPEEPEGAANAPTGA